MRLIYTFLVAAFSVTSLYSATIQFESTFLGVVNGQRQFRNTYLDVDTPLQVNQALEIQFDPILYGNLSNPQAPSNFNVLLIQPNNPPGLAGLYSALALTNTLAPVGPFSVDFIFLGAGTPGSQAFQINQFNAQGGFVSTVASGVTTTVIPEPGGLATAGLALLVCGAWRIKRFHFRT